MPPLPKHVKASGGEGILFWHGRMRGSSTNKTEHALALAHQARVLAWKAKVTDLHNPRGKGGIVFTRRIYSPFAGRLSNVHGTGIADRN